MIYLDIDIFHYIPFFIKIPEFAPGNSAPGSLNSAQSGLRGRRDLRAFVLCHEMKVLYTYINIFRKFSGTNDWDIHGI